MQPIQILLTKTEEFRTRMSIPPFVFAVISVLSAFLVRLSLNPVLNGHAPLILFILSVLLSSWYGGFRTGLFATLFALIVGTYFFIQPHNILIVDQINEIAQAIVFLLEGFLIALLSEARNHLIGELNRVVVAEHKARIKAEQAMRYREDFISVASHELKTPVTSLKAYTQLLGGKARKEKLREYVQYTNQIEGQTDKLIGLINDLLDVSRMQSGRLKFTFAKTNLTDTIHEVVKEMQDISKKHQLVVKTRGQGVVWADKDRIQQVLINLISNAIKYSPKGGKVIISLLKMTGTTQVSVRDYGIGISPENRRKIFSRFFRVSEEGIYPGLGIGLFISSEIIKRHKGKMWVESTLGKGSTFYFSLPEKQSTAD